jgi:protein AFG1
VLREQGAPARACAHCRDSACAQTKLFVSSEVPIFQIFSDEGARPGEISAHMRSIMDDLGLPAGVVGASSMFTGDEELFAFARCCSRLVEMGSQQWAERARGAA